MNQLRLSERVRFQLRLLARIFILVGIPTALLFGLLYGVASEAGIPFRSLTRDPAATYRFPWYVGSFSLIGVVMPPGQEQSR